MEIRDSGATNSPIGVSVEILPTAKPRSSDLLGPMLLLSGSQNCYVFVWTAGIFKILRHFLAYIDIFSATNTTGLYSVVRFLFIWVLEVTDPTIFGTSHWCNVLIPFVTFFFCFNSKYFATTKGQWSPKTLLTIFHYSMVVECPLTVTNQDVDSLKEKSSIDRNILQLFATKMQCNIYSCW